MARLIDIRMSLAVLDPRFGLAGTVAVGGVEEFGQSAFRASDLVDGG